MHVRICGLTLRGSVIKKAYKQKRPEYIFAVNGFKLSMKTTFNIKFKDYLMM